MPTRRIAIALSKGGVGKSTTAVNLAHGLAMSGSRVLLVDSDTLGRSSDMLGLQPDIGLAEIITGAATPDEAILEAREGLSILAGGKALAGLKREISRQDFGGEQTFKKALTPIEKNFDYVIVDTGPGYDALTINVLFYVQEILSPVSMEVLTLRGLLDFQSALADIQKHNKGLTLKYVLPTFVDGRVKKSEEILRQLRSHYKKQICSPIRYNVRLSEAPGHGLSIYEYAPRSAGAEDYKKLTQRVAKDG